MGKSGYSKLSRNTAGSRRDTPAADILSLALVISLALRLKELPHGGLRPPALPRIGWHGNVFRNGNWMLKPLHTVHTFTKRSVDGKGLDT